APTAHLVASSTSSHHTPRRRPPTPSFPTRRSSDLAGRAPVLDARDEFARGYIVRTLKADATGTGGGPLGIALGVPLVAKLVVHVAAIEHATALAHGSNGTAMDAAARSLNPALRGLAPARDWTMTDGQQAAYIRARQIPFATSGPTGGDGGAPEPAAVDLAFDRGVPTGVNGVAMPILDLLDSLGTIAAAHGVGQGKGGDLREAPAAV